jgi:shikimate kinase
VDIPYIFEREGEEGFRAREREVIADLTNRNGIVLATGGGAILAEESRKLLKERGVVVYLQASVQQQAERTGHGRHRPLLLTSDPHKKLEELMILREPLYREVAHHVIVTDGRKVKDVAADIAAIVGRQADPES